VTGHRGLGGDPSGGPFEHRPTVGIRLGSRTRQLTIPIAVKRASVQRRALVRNAKQPDRLMSGP
jgi:hypothetical protein